MINDVFLARRNIARYGRAQLQNKVRYSTSMFPGQRVAQRHSHNRGFSPAAGMMPHSCSKPTTVRVSSGVSSTSSALPKLHTCATRHWRGAVESPAPRNAPHRKNKLQHHRLLFLSLHYIFLLREHFETRHISPKTTSKQRAWRSGFRMEKEKMGTDRTHATKKHGFPDTSPCATFDSLRRRYGPQLPYYCLYIFIP